MEEYKELIALAAKAMGYIVESHCENGVWVYPVNYKLNSDEEPTPYFLWNPLTSLYDRAAMCDQLEIDIEWNAVGVGRAVRAWDTVDNFAVEYHDGSLESKSLACSLACLRVAAEVGRRM